MFEPTQLDNLPQDFTLKLLCNGGPCLSLPNAHDDIHPRLAAGDLQGRSLVLRPVGKVSYQSISPTIILGGPPTHIDWITPANAAGPTVLNLSAAPTEFFARYSFQQTTTKQSSTRATTSWTTAVAETGEAKLLIGAKKETNLSIELKEAFEELKEKNVDTVNDNYESTSFNAFRQTGFGDLLWFEKTRLQQLEAGEPVILEARVYNYSFAEMPQGTDVRVRFYGQRWNHNTNAPVGDSFLIDEKVHDRIPAFQSQELLSSGDNPFNWILARAEFDPTEHANQYLVFWVVVWMQDGDGNLVQEMADHGLEGKPGELKSIAQVPIEGHSNNVGLYKHAFYVKPSVPQGPAPEDADLVVEEMEATPEKVIAGGQVEIAAFVKNLGGPVDGAHALFFEGDPAGGGELFDSELISHIPAGGSYQLNIPFRPERCGLHRLFVVLQESHAIGETLRRRVFYYISEVALLTTILKFINRFVHG